MTIDQAVGKIRLYYLNLPKEDMTEGGEFVGKVLDELLNDERKRVIEEVESHPTFTHMGCDAILKDDLLNQLKGSDETVL